MLEGVQRVGAAAVGDKTMVDALEQAVLADRSQRFVGGARRRWSGT